MGEGLVLFLIPLTVPSIYDTGESQEGVFGEGCLQSPGRISGSPEHLTGPGAPCERQPHKQKARFRPDSPRLNPGSAFTGRGADSTDLSFLTCRMGAVTLQRLL